jgi:ribonuclease HI
MSPAAPQVVRKPSLPDAPEVELFADGSCLSNPGPGGWGFILRFKDTQREGSGGDPDTTNNRMEITAVLQGLSALKRPCRVRVTSDSQYVVKAINEWIAGWKRKGWRRSPGPGGELLNVDLWRALDELLHVHEVKACWVRGHDGHAENERCDELARAAAEAISAR